MLVGIANQGGMAWAPIPATTVEAKAVVQVLHKISQPDLHIFLPPALVESVFVLALQNCYLCRLEKSLLRER